MLPSRFLLHGICLLVLVSIVVAKCGQPIPLGYLALKGSTINNSDVIFTFNGSANGTARNVGRPINKTWILHYRRVFQILKLGTKFKLIIRQPWELRDQVHRFGKDICGLGMKLSIDCYDGPLANIKHEYVRYLYVRPDDNVLTVDSNATWFDLSEDSDIGNWTKDLHRWILTPSSSIRKYRFVANPYNRTLGWYDARMVLTLHSNGVVRLHTYLDSEEWSPLMRYYLNITYFASLTVCKNQTTVEGGPWRSVTGIMTFKLINVNDNPPRFVMGGCPPLCGPPNYKAWVSRTFTGEITDVEDGPIAAHDPDGDLNKYSLSGGTPESYNHYFAITESFGVVSVTRPIGTVIAEYFNLTIKVQSFTVLRDHAPYPPNDTAYTSLIVNIHSYVLDPWRTALASSNSFFREPYIIVIILMIVAVLLM